MNQFRYILQHYFQKESLQDIPVETLEQFATDNPLFTPAHLLLTKKYQETSDASYQRHVQKTALHFHDPLWLHFQLMGPVNNKEVNYAAMSNPGNAEQAEITVPETSGHDLIEEVVVHQEIVPEVEISPNYSYPMEETPPLETEPVETQQPPAPEEAKPADKEDQKPEEGISSTLVEPVVSEAPLQRKQ